jgi:putative aldouronate transport system permease protein
MKMKNKGINENKIFNFVNLSIVSIFTLIIVIPIWSIVVASFSNGHSLSNGGITFWPKEFTLENYKAVFNDSAIWKAFVISILKTVIGVVTHVFFTAMAAYAMSKSYLAGRKVYSTIGVITMFFSGGMIPVYLLIKSLGLLNSFWVYIIPALFSYYDMIILMNFFREIPASLEEAAMIDGAGVWQTFVRIVLPLSKPVMSTIALFNGVYQWNDYMTAKLYVTDKALYPVQMKLYEIIVQQQTQAMNSISSSVVLPTTTRSIQLATIVIATVPILLIYPFLQKHLLSGMMIGAVKG